MQRIWLAVVVGACASPPDTCDQHVAGDIQIICSNFRSTVQTGSAMHATASFQCDGGGSGTMDISGNVQWSGTFTFDACTQSAAVSGDTLTLTGSLYITGDNLNDSYAVMTNMLTMRGSASTCAAPIDETCAMSVDPPNYSFFEYDHLHGTLCGRHF